MKRAAFKMKLKDASYINEYKKRHDEIWPELKKLLTDAGVYDYSIFFDEDNLTLFAVQKTSGEGGSQDLGTNPIVHKWWDFMADIMETESNNAPVSIELPEVFHLD